jgi:hypothetical protein
MKTSIYSESVPPLKTTTFSQSGATTSLLSTSTQSKPEAPRRRLREIYLSLRLDLARLYERRVEYEKGIEALREVVSEEPFREEAHAALMRHYALSRRNLGIRCALRW